nr:uncharacterized protein LOC111417709 isoform X2 [Onthophagus taurus]
MPLHFYVDISSIMEDTNRTGTFYPENNTYQDNINIIIPEVPKLLEKSTAGLMQNCLIVRFDKFHTFESSKEFIVVNATDSYHADDPPVTGEFWFYYFVPKNITGINRVKKKRCLPGSTMFQEHCMWQIDKIYQGAICVRAKVIYSIETGENLTVTVGDVIASQQPTRFYELAFPGPLALEFYFVFAAGHEFHNYNSETVVHSEQNWHFLSPIKGDDLKTKIRQSFNLYRKDQTSENERTTYAIRFYAQDPLQHYNPLANYYHTLIVSLTSQVSQLDEANARLYFRLVEEILDDLTSVIDTLGRVFDSGSTRSDNLFIIEDLAVRLTALLIRLDLPEHVEATPKFVVSRSRLTHRLSKIINRALWAASHPMAHAAMVDTAYYSLRHCMHVNLGEKKKEEMSTTMASAIQPIEIHKYIPEDYPDYDEDSVMDSSTSDMVRYSTMLIFNASHYYGEIFILTSTLGDEAPAYNLKYFEQKFYVFDFPQLILGLTAAVFGHIQVRVQSPIEFLWTKSDFMKVFITVFKREVFYFMNFEDSVPLDIVVYNSIVHSGRVGKHTHVRELQYPVEVMYRYPSPDTIQFQNHTFLLPAKWQEWTDELMNKEMYLMRIQMSTNTVLTIIIRNITGFPDDADDEALKVVILDTNYPFYPDHFRTSDVYYFSDNQSVHYYVHTKSNSIMYVGILPVRPGPVDVEDEDGKSDDFQALIQEQVIDEDDYGDIRYSMAVLTYKCSEMGDMKVVDSEICKVPQNRESLNESDVLSMLCTCDSGTFSLVPILRNLEQPVWNSTRTHFTTDFTYSYVLFILLIIIFFIYCLLLAFAGNRARPMIFLCFTCDSNKSDRYGYLIAVKTSSLQNSGTTSNVIIKLHGRKANSLPYVLNYPDPDLRLLQLGGDDYFVIATAEHLGDLRYIELWTDVIGYNSCWRCENVRVFDLRRNKKWYFDVQRTFALRDKMDCYHKTYVTTKVVPRRKVRDVIQYVGLHFGPYHTFNIFDPAHDYQFGYLFRLTLVASHILMALSLSVMFISFPRMQPRDVLGIDYYAHILYFLMYVFVIGLICSIIHFTLAVLYRNTSGYGLLKTKTELFPKIVSRILWIILVIFITLSMAYLLIFGWWVSPVALCSMIMIFTLVLLLNIILLENLYISIYLLYKSFRRLKRIDIFGKFNFGNIVLEVENQRRFLYRRINVWSVRPFLKHLYRPLSDALLKERRQIDQLRQNLRSLLSNIVLVILLGIFFLILTHLQTSDQSALMTKHVEEMFIDGKFVATGMKAENVFAMEDFYLYLNKTIIPTSISKHWYGRYKTEDPALTADFQTKLTTIVRIRKIMAKLIKCPDESLAKLFYVKECLPYWSANVTDTTGYDEGTSMFNYQIQQYQHRYYPFMENAYESGGFMVPLGRTLPNSYNTLVTLNDSLWFMNETRAFFIEFLLFNANTGLFIDVRILFERGPSKFIILTERILNTRLSVIGAKIEAMFMICFGLMVIITILLARNVINQVLKRGLKFLIRKWTIMDLAIIVCVIAYCILSILKHYERSHFESQISVLRRNEFVPPFSTVDIDEEIRILAGFILFLCIIRLSQLFHYIKFLRRFAYTLSRIFGPILFVFLCTMLGYFAMALIARLCYVSDIKEFHSISMAFSTQWVIFARLKTPAVQYLKEESGFHQLYLLTLFIIGIVVKIVVIVITLVVFRECKKLLSGLQWRYELVTFTKEFFNYYYEYTVRTVIPIKKKTNLRAGREEFYEAPITSKELRYRYESLYKIGINKMNLMRFALLAILRNKVVRQRKDRATDKDFALMEEIARAVYVMRHSVTKETEGLRDTTTLYSFGYRVPNKRARLVSDARILEMEMVSQECVTTARLEQLKAITQDRVVMVPDLLTLGRMETMYRCLVLIAGLFGNITLDIDPKFSRRPEEEYAHDDNISTSVSNDSLSDENISGDEIKEKVKERVKFKTKPNTLKLCKKWSVVKK